MYSRYQKWYITCPSCGGLIFLNFNLSFIILFAIILLSVCLDIKVSTRIFVVDYVFGVIVTHFFVLATPPLPLICLLTMSFFALFLFLFNCIATFLLPGLVN